MTTSPIRGKGLSFRARLILYGVILTLLVGMPFLYVEAKRPWEVLRAMIHRGYAVMAGADAGFERDEIRRLDAFALRISAEVDAEDDGSLVWTFNLLVDEGKLPSAEAMQAAFAENEIKTEKFDYARVEKAFAFWKDRFDGEPGLLELFRKYRRKLIEAKQSARKSGFELEDLYIMVDDGQTFAILLDGNPWWDSSYTGMVYDVVEYDCEYWRDYLKDGPGFYHNPMHYSFGIFPKFDTDEWGTWFTIWMAVDQGGGVWNAYSIDFDAATVKKQMWGVAGASLAALLVLAGIIAVFSGVLSRLISEPIQSIVKGAEAVMREDFDHVVPASGSPEFRITIEAINRMIRQLKEKRELEISLQELRELDKMKDNFLSMVSHDLRTPMTSIKGYAALLHEKAGRLDPEIQKESLAIIIEEADRLTRLITNLLDLQRYGAGRMKLKKEPVDLAALAQKSIDSFRGAALAKKQTLLFRPADRPFLADGDPDRLAQVMANLLSNAIKFTPEGGRIEAAVEAAELEGKPAAKVMVEDTGPGIPAEELSRVFDRFQLVESLGRDQDQGSGLGLALVRETVQHHGGKAGVESEPGQGSRFFFILPLRIEVQ